MALLNLLAATLSGYPIASGDEPGSASEAGRVQADGARAAATARLPLGAHHKAAQLLRALANVYPLSGSPLEAGSVWNPPASGQLVLSLARLAVRVGLDGHVAQFALVGGRYGRRQDAPAGDALAVGPFECDHLVAHCFIGSSSSCRTKLDLSLGLSLGELGNCSRTC